MGVCPDSTAYAGGIFLCKRIKRPKDIPLSLDALSSALSLLVALVGRADHHDLALSFDHLAFIAHGLYARSNFHFDFLLIEIGINPCFSK